MRFSRTARHLLVAAGILCLAGRPVAAAESQVVQAPKGMPIVIEFPNGLSTRTLHGAVRTSKKAVAAAAVRVGGKRIVDERAPVHLDIESYPAGFAGAPGHMSVDIVSVTAVDGTRIPLQGRFAVAGKPRRAISIGIGVPVIALGALLFLAQPVVGIIVALAGVGPLFVRGEQAEVEAGTTYDAEVESTTSIAVDGAAQGDAPEEPNVR